MLFVYAGLNMRIESEESLLWPFRTLQEHRFGKWVGRECTKIVSWEMARDCICTDAMMGCWGMQYGGCCAALHVLSVLLGESLIQWTQLFAVLNRNSKSWPCGYPHLAISRLQAVRSSYHLRHVEAMLWAASQFPQSVPFHHWNAVLTISHYSVARLVNVGGYHHVE